MKTGITKTWRLELERHKDRDYKDLKTGITKTWREGSQRLEDWNYKDMKTGITKTWRQESQRHEVKGLQRLEDWNYKYMKSGIAKIWRLESQRLELKYSISIQHKIQEFFMPCKMTTSNGLKNCLKRILEVIQLFRWYVCYRQDSSSWKLIKLSIYRI